VYVEERGKVKAYVQMYFVKQKDLCGIRKG